ncbi:MAG: M1 family aminopeptidase [Vicingaceae bacterium]
MKNRFLLFAFLVLICSLKAGSQNLRSDTVDLLHTHIHLDITDFAGQTINGYAELTCTPLTPNVDNLNLDLLSLTVDSVRVLGNTSTYNHNDTLLSIKTGTSYQVGDTFLVRIFYQGKPFKESWGGFKFDALHAFNLGVGFTTDPHSLGRAWFPCFDNFVERSTFSYEIITADGRTSYCNGSMTSQVNLLGDTIMRTWEMNQPIPAYLANVAVSEYEELSWNHSGIAGNIPVLLAVRASDSANMRASFTHLDDAIQAYETAFGPHRFNKVGFCVVPMGGGMEHASNISYARNAVTGNLNNESLMAHELAHMWWGDLVTCDKQEEMWINEGMASYGEHLFWEHTYGRDRYLKEVKANFMDCIQYLHIREGKYWPISGIPHSMTYSGHVYNKGAVVGHNLRGYMGDSLFFDGVKRFMDDHQFQDVNSTTLRDKLEQYSGLDLDDFFDDWVFGPGYANVNIDSMVVKPSPGLNDVTIYIHQKKRGSDHFFNNMPIEVSFYNDQFNEITEKVLVSGEYSNFSFSLPMSPVFAALNAHDELNLATTADQAVLKEKDTYEFINGKWNLELEQANDSILFRVEHHWAPADEGPSDYRMSTDRYWELRGIAPGGLVANAVIYFDARGNQSGGIGNLDNELLVDGPDSVVLMYRKYPSNEWKEYDHYEKFQFGPLPFGRMELDSVLFGQYSFAKGKSYLGHNQIEEGQLDVRLYPNPASSKIRIENRGDADLKLQMRLFDATGKMLWQQAYTKSIDIDTSTFRTGTYFVVMLNEGKQVWCGQFVVAP